jgi:hypothetical protein
VKILKKIGVFMKKLSALILFSLVIGGCSVEGSVKILEPAPAQQQAT